MTFKKAKHSFVYFQNNQKFFDLSTAFNGAIFGYNNAYFNHRIKNYLSRYPYPYLSDMSPTSSENKESHPIYQFLPLEFKESHPFVYSIEKAEIFLTLLSNDSSISLKDINNTFNSSSLPILNGEISNTYKFIQKAMNIEAKAISDCPLKKKVLFLNHGPLQLAPEQLMKIPYLVFDLNHLISYQMGFFLVSQTKLDLSTTLMPITKKLIKDISRYFHSQPIQAHRKKIQQLIHREMKTVAENEMELCCYQDVFFILKKKNSLSLPKTRVYYKNISFIIYDNFVLLGIPLNEPLHHLPSKLKEVFEYLENPTPSFP